MVEKQHFISGLQLWQWRNKAIQAAIAADVSPYEVDWLLQEVAGLERLSIRLQSFKDWSQIQLQLPLEELEVLWQRRLDERLPVQYITGVTPWRQFKIVVSSAVLIPRPETEYLIDLAVTAAQEAGEDLHLDQGQWADLGTGSGAIALGLADAFPKATIHAVDRCADALAIAQRNAHNYGLTERIHFYQGSWWQPLESLKGQFSGMVSNPPYIPSVTLSTLQAEVIHHEPHLALDGGESGLDCIRHLINVSPTYLRPGGVWLIEMMAGQADMVKKLLETQGSYCHIQILPDLAGIERFAIAQIRSEGGKEGRREGVKPLSFASTLPHSITPTLREAATASTLPHSITSSLHHPMTQVTIIELITGARAGKLVSFPTDTVPALAALPEQAELIFTAKQRSQDKPLILMAASANDLWSFVQGSDEEYIIWQQTVQKYWPGALTLVLPSSEKVPTVMNPINPTTIGIRVPDCAIAQQILAQTGPLATTSANLSGQPALQTMGEIAATFPEVLTLKPIEENQKSLGSGLASTVAQWKDKNWQILRQGIIKL